jgi:rRNA processing protein Gar1
MMEAEVLGQLLSIFVLLSLSVSDKNATLGVTELVIYLTKIIPGKKERERERVREREREKL